MQRGRLEAFSDGVLAIVITIMVLELKAPHGSDLSVLSPLTGKFLAYVMSFIYIGIYWNNHHHMMHTVERVNGAILWANLHLLFWLSMVPFASAWLGENGVTPYPTAVYGFCLFMAGFAYYLLQQAIIHGQGAESRLRRAVGKDWKGKASVISYAISLPISFVQPWASVGVYLAVAMLWLVPDRRIEAHIS